MKGDLNKRYKKLFVAQLAGYSGFSKTGACVIQFCPHPTTLQQPLVKEYKLNPVTRWESYIEHDSLRDGFLAGSGRSFSYRSEWSGQPQGQRSLVTQRKAQSRESHWPGRTGSDPTVVQLEPTAYQTSPDYTNPQVSISQTPPHLFQNNEQNLRPSVSNWIHYRQELPEEQSRIVQNSPLLGNVFDPQSTWIRNTDFYENPSVQQPEIFFTKDNPSLLHTINKEPYQKVVLPKQDIVRLRNTEESTFGENIASKQPTVSQQYVQIQQPQNIDFYSNGLVNQRENIYSKDFVPEGYSFLSPKKFNVDILPPFNQRDGSHRILTDQNIQQIQIDQPVVYQTPSQQPEYVTANESYYQFAPTTERTNLFEITSPSDTDVYGDILYHEEKSTFTTTTNPLRNLHNLNIENQDTIHNGEVIIRGGNGGKANTRLEVSFESSLTTSNQPTKHTLPLGAPFDRKAQSSVNVEENEDDSSIQFYRSWDSCVGPGHRLGRCVPVDLCNLEGNHHHYSASQKYYCIIRQKQSIGICCINWKKESLRKDIAVSERVPDIQRSVVEERQGYNSHRTLESSKHLNPLQTDNPNRHHDYHQTVEPHNPHQPLEPLDHYRPLDPYNHHQPLNPHSLHQYQKLYDNEKTAEPHDPHPSQEPHYHHKFLEPHDNHKSLEPHDLHQSLEPEDLHQSLEPNNQPHPLKPPYRHDYNQPLEPLDHQHHGNNKSIESLDPHYHHDNDHHHPYDPHYPHHHEHCIYPIADYKVCGRGGKAMSNVTAAASASARDWPWSVVLIMRSDRSQFCGGTLITRRHVLTAAHCFRTTNPNDTFAVLGEYDVTRVDESRTRTFAIEQLITNDDYDPATHEADIALIVLNATTVYNDYIQPACLPAPWPRYTNSTAVLTGWGRVQYNGRLPPDLMEVPLPVWDQEMCVERFAQNILDTFLCAGAFEGGRDSCQGDSGGALLKQCYHSHRWVVIGIVSWGIRCAEKDKPGIYTRVSEYLDWIHENIVDNTTETTEPPSVHTIDIHPVHYHFF